MRVWNFLDGHKTDWGSVLFTFATLLQQQGYVDTAMVDTYLGWAQVLGAVLAVFGVGHKAVKRMV